MQEKCCPVPLSGYNIIIFMLPSEPTTVFPSIHLLPLGPCTGLWGVLKLIPGENGWRRGRIQKIKSLQKPHTRTHCVLSSAFTECVSGHTCSSDYNTSSSPTDRRDYNGIPHRAQVVYLTLDVSPACSDVTSQRCLKSVTPGSRTTTLSESTRPFCTQAESLCEKLDGTHAKSLLPP